MLWHYALRQSSRSGSSCSLCGFYLPPANEVAGRWYFHSSLLGSLFTGDGVPCGHYPWCIGPLDLTVQPPPPGLVPLVLAAGDQDGRPVQTCSPQDPHQCWHLVTVVGKRALCILLECFLVSFFGQLVMSNLVWTGVELGTEVTSYLTSVGCFPVTRISQQNIRGERITNCFHSYFPHYAYTLHTVWSISSNSCAHEGPLLVRKSIRSCSRMQYLYKIFYFQNIRSSYFVLKSKCSGWPGSKLT